MIEIGNRICLKNVMEKTPVPEGKLEILLVPTIAFGDGRHESTRKFLQEMERLVFPGMTLFDAGTGSGILTVAAIKLGATKVYSIDVSRMALMTLSANLNANGIGGDQVEYLRSTYESVEFPPVDMILCNIPDIRPVLAGMEASYRLLFPGGLFLTMPPVRDVPEVEDSAKDVGFKILDEQDDRKWAFRIFQKPLMA